MEWMHIDDYCGLTGLEREAVEELIARKKLHVMEKRGEIYIDPSKGAKSVVPAKIRELRTNQKGDILVGEMFIERTIGTIINLHEKVLDAKDETIESVKNENTFLKEALSSLQELYDEDRKTIETLTQQLKHAQSEVEFMRRKYKLMWGKVIDEYADPSRSK
jgi:DNA repair exonuclease SbcCD ATPase subunit